MAELPTHHVEPRSGAKRSLSVGVSRSVERDRRDTGRPNDAPPPAEERLRLISEPSGSVTIHDASIPRPPPERHAGPNASDLARPRLRSRLGNEGSRNDGGDNGAIRGLQIEPVSDVGSLVEQRIARVPVKREGIADMPNDA